MSPPGSLRHPFVKRDLRSETSHVTPYRHSTVTPDKPGPATRRAERLPRQDVELQAGTISRFRVTILHTGVPFSTISRFRVTFLRTGVPFSTISRFRVTILRTGIPFSTISRFRVTIPHAAFHGSRFGSLSDLERTQMTYFLPTSLPHRIFHFLFLPSPVLLSFMAFRFFCKTVS